MATLTGCLCLRPQRTVALPGDTIQLLDNLEISPFSAAQIRKWTARDPILAKILEVLLSRSAMKDADEFQPYLRRRRR